MFFGSEFDILQMETRLPKNLLRKNITGVAKVLERKSCTIDEEL